MSEGCGRYGFVTPDSPEVFKPVRWNDNGFVNCDDNELDDNMVPETQYSITNYQYVSPFKRDEAIVHFDLNGKSFFKRVFKAFPLSKIIQFQFKKDKMDAIIEQTKTYSFSVTMERDVFDVYNINTDNVLISISSKLFLHIINELKNDNDLMRFFYNGEGSDLIIDVLGCGEFKSEYIPTISCTEYKELSLLEVEKELEIIISPMLLLRVLKSTDKYIKDIVFSFLTDTFEIILENGNLVRQINVCYNDPTYVYKVSRLKDINIGYPISPFFKIQKALRVGNEVNLCIYKNGLIKTTIYAKDIKGTTASFELYVVPKFDTVYD
uniref:Peptidase S1 domain-containing protein n=1 Tax=Strongyloides stercoralis TaxID=6248 RepID=A0A0K0DUR7_STRER